MVAIPFEVGQVSTMGKPVIEVSFSLMVAIPFEVGQVSTLLQGSYWKLDLSSRNPF